MNNTKIEWCHSTMNFWSGCTKVSPGCANCYAETLSNRNLGTPGRGGAIGKWGPGAPRKLHESAFKEAHRLNRKPWVCDQCGKETDEPEHGHHWTPEPASKSRICPGVTFHRRRIFSLSLGDWLDPEIQVEWLARMLDTIRQCQDVRWLLRTKRPELWLERMTLAIGYDVRNRAHGMEFNNWLSAWTRGHAPHHVLIGTSVEDQQRADERIPALLRIPAAGRFLSIEPLLAEVDLSRWLIPCVGDGFEKPDWLIIGGESGPQARPCNVDWIRLLVGQGKLTGVAVFVKQLGAYSVEMPRHDGDTGFQWSLKDRKGADPAEWPEDLRVREFPEVLR